MSRYARAGVKNTVLVVVAVLVLVLAVWRIAPYQLNIDKVLCVGFMLRSAGS